MATTNKQRRQWGTNASSRYEGGVTHGMATTVGEGGIRRYDPEEIGSGVEREMEHTQNPAEALKIAMDHLNERSDYYSKLEKCLPEKD